jgi:hypothetical protein
MSMWTSDELSQIGASAAAGRSLSDMIRPEARATTIKLIPR